MTTLLHRTIQQPTAIELSVWCRFANENAINLCVAKANVLEIYSAIQTVVEEEESDEEGEEGDDDGSATKEPETNTSLRIVAKYSLFGRIETMNKISFNSAVAKSCGEASGLDALLLT